MYFPKLDSKCRQGTSFSLMHLASALTTGAHLLKVGSGENWAILLKVYINYVSWDGWDNAENSFDQVNKTRINAMLYSVG